MNKKRLRELVRTLKNGQLTVEDAMICSTIIDNEIKRIESYEELVGTWCLPKEKKNA